MRLWFALHWAMGIPLTEQFRPRAEPPFIRGGHGGSGRVEVDADALVFWVVAEGFKLWDVRKDLPGCGLGVLSAVHGTGGDLGELRRKWRWQSVVPVSLVEHFACDLYNLVARALNKSNLSAAPPAEQPPQEGDNSHV